MKINRNILDKMFDRVLGVNVHQSVVFVMVLLFAVVGSIVASMLLSCGFFSGQQRDFSALKTQLYTPALLCSALNGERYSALKARQDEVIAWYDSSEHPLETANSKLDALYAADDRVRDVVAGEFVDESLIKQKGRCMARMERILLMTKTEGNESSIKREMLGMINDILSIQDDLKLLGKRDMFPRTETINGMTIEDAFIEFIKFTGSM